MALVFLAAPVSAQLFSSVEWTAIPLESTVVAPHEDAILPFAARVENGYGTSRTLKSVEFTLEAGSDPSEYLGFALLVDRDFDGKLDEDGLLSIASPESRSILFQGFELELPSRQPAMLVVVAALNPAFVRDGALISAIIRRVGVIEYEEGDLLVTSSSGDFPIDSGANHVVDGHYARQLRTVPLNPRTLAGGEADVVCLALKVPSNGFEPDILRSLVFALTNAPGEISAQLGTDIDRFALWHWDPPSQVKAEFGSAVVINPNDMTLLAELIPGAPELRFGGLDLDLAEGGSWVIITATMGGDPTDGSVLKVQLPAHGIEVESGNDGPIDGSFGPTVSHGISRALLLSEIRLSSPEVAVGQDLELEVLVTNKGTSSVGGVELLGLAAPVGTEYLSGPTPAVLSLAAGMSDTVRLQLRVNQATEGTFVAAVGIPDSSVVAAPSSSGLLRILNSATALDLEALDLMPRDLNRGSLDEGFLAWTLRHPDADSLRADLLIHSLVVEVEDADGMPMAANSALDSLRIHAGGSLLAAVGADASPRLVLLLDPPLRLSPEEERNLSLRGDIRVDAPATSLRLRLLDGDLGLVQDPNDESIRPILGSFPWTTTSALLRTRPTHVDIAREPILGPAANRGQTGLGLANFHLDLAAPAGQAEARLHQLALVLRDSIGDPCNPAVVFERLRLRAGDGTLLSDTLAPDNAEGALNLIPDNPRLLVAGSLASFRVEADLKEEVLEGAFHLALGDSSLFDLRDLASGEALPAILDDGGLPMQGPVVLEEPAPIPRLELVERGPAQLWVGESGLELCRVLLRHPGVVGDAALRVDALSIRLRDALDRGLPPSSLFSGARLRNDQGQLLRDLALPGDPEPWLLSDSGSHFLAPGDSLAWILEVDLSPVAPAGALRVEMLDADLQFFDSNDSTRTMPPSTDLPASTPARELLDAATDFSVAVAKSPPTQFLAGTSVVLTEFEVQHLGGTGQGDLEAESLRLGILQLGVNGFAESVVSRADLLVDAFRIPGLIAEDSLRFDLTGLPTLPVGESWIFRVEIETPDAPTVEDFQIVLGAFDFRVRSAGEIAMAQPGEGISFPWISNPIHVVRPDFANAFQGFPNPFAAGRDRMTLSFFLEADDRVDLSIHTLDGRLVRRLLKAELRSAGLHDDVQWDGLSATGAVVRNGIYLLRLGIASGPERLHKVAVKR